MLLDRIFGMIAAAGFALGVIDQLELLLGARAGTENFGLLSLVTFALFFLSFLYLFSQGGQRDGLEIDNGELAFWPMVARLPAWALAISVILLFYAVTLCAISALTWAGYGPTRPRFPDGLAFGAMPTALSFAIAAFCLFRTKSAVDD